MSISQTDVNRLRRAVLESLHEHWVFYLIEGIVLICLGAAAVIRPSPPWLSPLLSDGCSSSADSSACS